MRAFRRSARLCPWPTARFTLPRWAGRWRSGRRARRRQPRRPLPAGAVTGPHHDASRWKRAQAGPELKPPQPDAAKQQAQQQPATPQVTTQFTPAVDYSGIEKSAVYRINPDNTVETAVDFQGRERLRPVAASRPAVLFSTDGNGRIYGLAPDRKVTLLVQTNEGEATRLLAADRAVLAAYRQHGAHLPARRCLLRKRHLRIPGVRHRQHGPMGEPELARRSSRPGRP